jgi:glyoxylase-like metal-dependent hydrolase (beta-lactamase superfamily II)
MSPPLPPVEAVVPGCWAVPVPLRGSPLGYTLIYAFERTDSGLVLVDAGLDTPEGFEAINAGLGRIGAGVADVRGIAVTHIHPDHYGLCGRIREASGAWVALHPADAALIPSRYELVDELLEDIAGWLREAGAPEAELAALPDASLEFRKYVTVTKPDVELHDGMRLEAPGWELVALHTAGHTPGHCCFVDRAAGIVLTGDHVLPRITPNINRHAQSGPNPLAAFLASLERLRPHADLLALPAHEWRFTDLGGRLDELAAHHTERLDETAAVVAAGAETVWDVAERLTWSRGWDALHGFMRRAALGEAHAHLALLEERERIRRVAEHPLRWRPAAAAPA